jgi:short-subunit dehydrogenase
MGTEAGKSLVILGGASRVGRALAHAFAREGYDLLLGDLDLDEAGYVADDVRVRHGVSVQTLAFDAATFDTHAAFVDSCETALGGIPDGLVVCFGYMAEQEAAQNDFTLVLRMIDVNLTGTMSVLERFASKFAARGVGFIAVLSSVAGDRGRQSNYLYGTTKAGLSAYLQGLRNRLQASGVQVLTVKPGFMDTKMTYGLPLPALLVATPEQAAQDIVRAVRKRQDVVYVRFFWRYIMLIIRWIPECVFKRMHL